MVIIEQLQECTVYVVLQNTSCVNCIHCFIRLGACVCVCVCISDLLTLIWIITFIQLFSCFNYHCCHQCVLIPSSFVMKNYHVVILVIPVQRQLAAAVHHPSLVALQAIAFA
jgi:hypothetical protein